MTDDSRPTEAAPERAWVRVDTVDDARGIHEIARILGVSVSDARALASEAPVRLPRIFSATDVSASLDRLRHAGVSASAEPVREAPSARCQFHGELINDGTCRECGAWICAVCRALADGARICPDCRAALERRARFRRWRVAVLLVTLAVVVSWAVSRQMRRGARVEWERTLRVALVLVEQEEVDPAAMARLEERVPELELWFAEQARRYRPGIVEPVEFTIAGPIAAERNPPVLSAEPGIWERIRHAWRLDDYLSGLDERGRFEPSSYDARLYLLVERAGADDPRFVEGIAEKGGEFGLVEVDLDEETVDLALIAATHELFHLLGAPDQYGPDGRVYAPSGLADPEREPLFPQDHAEIMARSIPKSEDEAELADELSEVVVGRATARSIGW